MQFSILLPLTSLLGQIDPGLKREQKENTQNQICIIFQIAFLLTKNVNILE